MKSEDIYNAVTELRDDQVRAGERKLRRTRTPYFRRIGALAAVLAVVILAGVVAGPWLGAALRRSQWLAQGPGYQPLLVRAQHEGWVSEMAYEQKHELNLQLDSYLTHAIAGLSGSRRAAIASDQGFCLAYAGYSEREAETLSAAAVDFFDFAQRQRQRGFKSTGRAISFHESVDMLMPTASLVLFFVDGVGYWLIIGGEPLLNNRALVEVIWSIRLTSGRYTNT